MDAETIKRFDAMESKLGEKRDRINDVLTKITIQKTRLRGIEKR